ncbi:MAG: hypothetical protein LPK03_14580 [Pontibacter sp.]|nr:hypothetical protein [Pontibacter sp.]
MNRTYTSPLLFIIGAMLLAGTAACLFVYRSFNSDEFDIDTNDEHSEDYL